MQLHHESEEFNVEEIIMIIIHVRKENNNFL
jgi:hypothetical protein